MSTLLRFAAPSEIDAADPELVRQALIEMGFAAERVTVGPPRPVRDYFGSPSARQAEVIVARGRGYADGVSLHADIGLQAVNGRYHLHIDHLDHPFDTADENGYEVDEETFMRKLIAAYGVAKAVRAAETIARNIEAEAQGPVHVRRRVEGGKIVLRVEYPD